MVLMKTWWTKKLIKLLETFGQINSTHEKHDEQKKCGSKYSWIVWLKLTVLSWKHDEQIKCGSKYSWTVWLN